MFLIRTWWFAWEKTTQLLTLNYLLYSPTDAAPQFLQKLTPFTKSWLQVLITLKSMRCRGASFQFMMAGSKSYFPTSIFANARFHIFSRNSIPIVISGDGTYLKILLITLVSNKVQRDAIYRKMESSKLSQYLNPISQLANFLKNSFKF